jgi:hypothetical protein
MYRVAFFISCSLAINKTGKNGGMINGKKDFYFYTNNVKEQGHVANLLPTTELQPTKHARPT